LLAGHSPCMGFVTSLKRGAGLLGPTVDDSLKYAEKGFTRVLGRLFLGYVLYFALFLGGGFLGGFIEGAGVPYAGVALFALGYVLGGLLLMAAWIGAIRNIYFGKKLPFFTLGNMWRGIKQTIPYLGIVLVICGVWAVGIMSNNTAMTLAGIAAAVLLGILAIPVVLLLLYFSNEVAVTDKGLFGSIRGSVSLVRKNFWETMLFLAASLVLLGALYFLVYIIVYLAFIAGVVISLALVAALGTTAGLVMLVMYVVFMAVVVAVSVAITCAYLIAQTVFYRKLVEARTRKAA
jgi:hypothetical protein